MRVTDTLYVTTREAWRTWLEAHHTSAGEIWLVSYRTATGQPSLPYNDAVEEALCFGWIDSIRKSLDDERYAQRFTPRKPGSPYSQPNKERLRKLIERGQVMPEVTVAVTDILAEPFEYSADVIDALRANETAWEHFQRYSEAYRRIRVAFVNAARDRPSEFEKRLRHLVRMTERDRQYGYGIEAYY